MENIVYNELLIRGYHVDVGVVEIFDKNKEGKRIRKQLHNFAHSCSMCKGILLRL